MEHVFEKAGLGKAPFHVVGVEERRGPIPQIWDYLDGREWSADTCQKVRDALVAFGLEVNEPNAYKEEK